MKNVKSSEINNLKAAHTIDELISHGRRLHREAVVMGALKIFKLFRHHIPKPVQLEEKRGNLEFPCSSRYI